MRNQYSFEIHYTFPVDQKRSASRACNNYGGNLIQFANEKADGAVIADLVWAYKTGRCSLHDALAIEKDACRWFADHGATPIRRKIETEPWFNEGEIQYLESHARAWCDPALAREQGFHVNRREADSNGNPRDYIILTKRSNDARASFELELQMGLSFLMNSGARIGKSHVEAVILDTNRELDDGWMAKV